MSFWSKLRRRGHTPKDESGAADVAFKRMFDPNPQFMGILLCGVFLDERVGLSELERATTVKNWPKALISQAEVWSGLYLSWVLSKFIKDKYGDEFLEQSMASIYATACTLEDAERKSTVESISGSLKYWFPIFDACLAMQKDPDCPAELQSASNPFIVSYALIKHGPEGPLFLADEDAAQKAIADCLKLAVGLKWERFKRMVEIGSPLDVAK